MPDRHLHEESSAGRAMVGLPLQRARGSRSHQAGDGVRHFLVRLQVRVRHGGPKDLPRNDGGHARALALPALAVLGHSGHAGGLCLCVHRQLRQGGREWLVPGGQGVVPGG